MGKLNGKVALITGGSSGIGLATAKRFIEEGAKVVITGRNQDSLTAAVNELGKEHARAVQAEAADPAGSEKAVAAAIEQFGRLDIVFANAGVAGGTPLGDTKLEDFEHILKVNVTGVFFTVQAAVPYLQAGASVILVGSVLATTGGLTRAAYAASKGAVTSMARVFASELSPRGIRVNTVVPGATKTPIWGASGAEQMAKLEAGLSKSIPLGRLGEPEEIANAVLFLASDESSFVQAAELQVDGGADGAPFGAPIYRQ
ncbi:NAD(P)-dependent dehydrogenase, short-chain alcohol dehydrogenase family [Paenibacillus catalpae]|uniref:NAD(P)-dependent dehydrogenase, short-chain alcohol dehydrogenase family n=1 Tax=Paenibacillus catalpae TaxID=1045775 RepID=A0A1I2DIQ3_9BACL|nr:glucose 1-dehydrogenase [Paenibacillus catalpae]SFE80532.1 NAD(P)-dependent dehydrogenase, short-chain alcohol dehydrogenase family [Paenibacillus catalpae]